jgi:hypothetical protein
MHVLALQIRAEYKEIAHVCATFRCTILYYSATMLVE